MAKPRRIACFHGGGSNKEIFEIQCAQLELLLKSELEFHFFNGPFTRDAGPGVLPAFEDYEPYHNWFKVADDGTYTLLDGSGYDESGRDGIGRVKTLMKERGGEWAGAIGFSQGSRVVAGLLLDQQRWIEQGKPKESLDLKFGVLCNGGKEPMAKVPEHPSKERIRIPTLHVHGLRDQYLEYGRQQYAMYFDPETAKLHELDYHHAMPWKPAEVNALAEEIRKLYQSTENSTRC
ncbi:hypothetical protein E2P81_ATG06493 [Venturia nashicola]|uniref:Serine hydrolase domain-containing protein n=1 Tax=Venturia nashicola TaxID=86259 RepID=A0A4Z1NYG4_9PEZI|nr:hypothetical protein E6O75_ATG06659 [Venturia nashicola]TLD28147.1 hypothetical protein E2P81_ATG06493 [Venturia nashicola]